MENHIFDILKRPLLTERSTELKEKYNQYLFEVAPSASKGDIKRVIQETYKVKVTKVRTMNVVGKSRRMGRGVGFRSDWKKAIVTLEKGQKIELVEGAS